MGRKSLWPDSLNNKIKEMFVDQHKSLYQISKETGMHPQSIKRRLVKMGIEVRSKSKAATNRWAKNRSKDV